MLTISTLRATACHTIFTHLFSLAPNNPQLPTVSKLVFYFPSPRPKRFPCFYFRKSRHFFYFCFREVSMSSSSSSKIVVEYAKSSRSSCKKCSKTISAKALRLGLESRDARGFNMTKWHHLDCFPIRTESIQSAETIKGFALLQSSDQEALKKFVAECDKSFGEDTYEGKDKIEESNDQKRDENEEYAVEERNSKMRKDHKRDEDEEYAVDKRNSKKTKLSPLEGEVELDIAFSVSDIKNTYKDATLSPKWKAFQTIIFFERDDGLLDSSKIAAFDFDGCLANTSVKKVGADAWSLMYPSIPDKLQSLYNDGYKLVIFTNESNIERWKNKRQVAVDSKIGRLNNFIKQVKVPIQIFIACGLGKSAHQAEDAFRKPKPGMWRIMEKHFNSGIQINMDQSFYVGDAAGRPKDHSDADIKFAQAIGLKFYVPEEYFGA